MNEKLVASEILKDAGDIYGHLEAGNPRKALTKKECSSEIKSDQVKAIVIALVKHLNPILKQIRIEANHNHDYSGECQ